MNLLQNGVKLQKYLIFAAILFFVFNVINFSWLSDDAYITFRTIDNFVNGYGLRWNIDERVQAFTHPLWLFILSGFYFITGEIYFTSIFISIIFSVLTVLIFSFKICNFKSAAIFGIIVLTLSQGYIDFSTSGLENPLTHFLLTLFLFIHFKKESNLKNFFFLSLISGLIAFNRIDTILLTIFVLGYQWLRTSKLLNGLKDENKFPLINFKCLLNQLKIILVMILGLSPFILWEIFSIFYYGFPFPNTAYAKLPIGVDIYALLIEGLKYFIDTFVYDPLTLLIILGAVFLSFVKRYKHSLPVSIGIITYMVYVVRIGGDFMRGRFFTAPFLCALIIITLSCFLSFDKKWLLSIVIIICIFSLPPIPLPKYPRGQNLGVIKGFLGLGPSGVMDERLCYYKRTGLIPVLKNHFSIPTRAKTKSLCKSNVDSVAVKIMIGMSGFEVGPSVHIVDNLALADPLLSRLPITDPIHFRIGHFTREIPEGYLKTLESGQNKITDPDLALFYDKIVIITRGRLINPKRLIEIWNMNMGKYDHLIKSYQIRLMQKL
jgi:arabinofuranosyltransferase